MQCREKSNFRRSSTKQQKAMKVLVDLSEMQRSRKKEKLDVQTRQFQESKEYKRERDKMQWKNAKITWEQI